MAYCLATKREKHSLCSNILAVNYAWTANVLFFSFVFVKALHTEENREGTVSLTVD